MTDNDSLLSYVVQRSTTGLEDAATNALSFILSRSSSAMETLSDFLGDDCGPLPIATARPWGADAHGAVPDLACFDSDDTLVALIESKFWAGLTAHQPVTYWKRLPDDRAAVLLFLAPEYRIDQGSLWDDLVDRLREAEYELGPAVTKEGTVTAAAKVGQRRLILTSWEYLLGRMAQRAREDGDGQACFEITELQGLASAVIAGDRPTRDENLRDLITEAVERAVKSGWANTDGLRTGDAPGYYYARYLRLAGATAGLRIDYVVAKQTPDRPLWLWFFVDSTASVSMEEVRSALGSEAGPGLESCPGDVCVPIDLPVAADRRATLDAMVAEMERIAAVIDPDGPTYRGSRVTADAERSITRPGLEHAAMRRGKEHAAIRVVSWNIAKMHQPWRDLVEMDADVALLQEAGSVPDDVLDRVELSPHSPWLSHDPETGEPNYDRWPMVVRLSDRVKVEWFRQIGPIGVEAQYPHDVGVSGIGTLEVAWVIPTSGAEPFIAASMYAHWSSPHPTAGGNWIYSDASAHRIISDLTAFIGYYDSRDRHRILAAGDLNMSFQSTDQFDHRAQTVLDRFQALGLEYVGPQYPAGRRADPIPRHLNEESLDVPTYYHKPSNTPGGAYVQLDHVFASRGLHDDVRARALNEVTEWGPSDHCRICIDVGVNSCD